MKIENKYMCLYIILFKIKVHMCLQWLTFLFSSTEKDYRMVSAPGDSTFPQMHLTTSVVIIKSLTFFQWPPLIIPFNSDSLFDGKKLPRSDPRFITLKNGLKFSLTEHFFIQYRFCLFVCLIL